MAHARIDSNNLFYRLFFLVLLTALMSACGGGVVGNANNYVVIDDQTVIHLDEITLSEVNLNQTVCLVVFNSSVLGHDIKGNTLVGEKTLLSGNSTEMKMQLLRDVKTHESLFAELREGPCGEESGETVTSSEIVAQGSVDATRFTVTRSTVPYIEVVSQTLSRVGGNAVSVNKVISDRSAWLVAHRHAESQDIENQASFFGEILGYQLINVGHSEGVKVSLMAELSVSTDVVIVLYSNESQDELDEDFDSNVDLRLNNVLPVIITVTPPAQ